MEIRLRTWNDRSTADDHSELHLAGRRGRVGNKYDCRRPSKLAVSVDIVTDRTSAAWGTVGAVRSETIETLGDCSLERRRRAAGVGHFLASLTPPYRLVDDQASLGHFASGPVPCAKRGITSFQPLGLLATLGGMGAGTLTSKEYETTGNGSNDNHGCTWVVGSRCKGP